MFRISVILTLSISTFVDAVVRSRGDSWQRTASADAPHYRGFKDRDFISPFNPFGEEYAASIETAQALFPHDANENGWVEFPNMPVQDLYAEVEARRAAEEFRKPLPVGASRASLSTTATASQPSQPSQPSNQGSMASAGDGGQAGPLAGMVFGAAHSQTGAVPDYGSASSTGEAPLHPGMQMMQIPGATFMGQMGSPPVNMFASGVPMHASGVPMHGMGMIPSVVPTADQSHASMNGQWEPSGPRPAWFRPAEGPQVGGPAQAPQAKPLAQQAVDLQAAVEATPGAQPAQWAVMGRKVNGLELVDSPQWERVPVPKLSRKPILVTVSNAEVAADAVGTFKKATDVLVSRLLAALQGTSARFQVFVDKELLVEATCFGTAQTRKLSISYANGKGKNLLHFLRNLHDAFDQRRLVFTEVLYVLRKDDTDLQAVSQTLTPIVSLVASRKWRSAMVMSNPGGVWGANRWAEQKVVEYSCSLDANDYIVRETLSKYLRFLWKATLEAYLRADAGQELVFRVVF